MNTDNWIKAIEFDYPEYIPVSMWLLPATWMKYREKLEELVMRHPVVFGEHKKGSVNFDAVSGSYAEGQWVDPWGCVWSNVIPGCDGQVTGHPVPTREAVRKFMAPQGRVGIPHGFMFQRLYYLRGFEELMVDLAEEPPELQMLIDIVLERNMKELEEELKSGKLPRIVYFGDDLGIQTGLTISREKWCKYLKPCYASVFGRTRQAGHYVYFHSDGHIFEIIPDLVECGVSVINPQVRANGLDNLARACKGKLCVNLDLDRQMFPFCTPRRIEEHVREAIEKLGSPPGGLGLHAECGPDVPLENIEAIARALEKYRDYFRCATAGSSSRG